MAGTRRLSSGARSRDPLDLLTLRSREASVIRPGHLVRDAVDRALVGPNRRTGHRLDHFARAFGIVDPFLVEVIGACRDALRAFAGIDHAGIAAMQQLEEVVLRLAVAARVADQALR